MVTYFSLFSIEDSVHSIYSSVIELHKRTFESFISILQAITVVMMFEMSSVGMFLDRILKNVENFFMKEFFF